MMFAVASAACRQVCLSRVRGEERREHRHEEEQQRRDGDETAHAKRLDGAMDKKVADGWKQPIRYMK